MRSSETSLVPLTKGGCQGLGIVLDICQERVGDAGRDAAHSALAYSPEILSAVEQQLQTRPLKLATWLEHRENGGGWAVLGEVSLSLRFLFLAISHFSATTSRRQLRRMVLKSYVLSALVTPSVSCCGAGVGGNAFL